MHHAAMYTATFLGRQKHESLDMPKARLSPPLQLEDTTDLVR